uniref:Uncharacterized protein n=1 Tax=Megaselia scalaris TaxID=36166 RepID=T1GTK1_MEGSC
MKASKIPRVSASVNVDQKICLAMIILPATGRPFRISKGIFGKQTLAGMKIVRKCGNILKDTDFPESTENILETHERVGSLTAEACGELFEMRG